MRLRVQLSEEDLELGVSLIQEDMNMVVDFGQYQVIHIIDPCPTYEGTYIITPRIDDQWMLTEGTKMIDDVHILAIPRADVSNPFGGTTVTIG